jgi:molybdate transport system substrate-binding protein
MRLSKIVLLALSALLALQLARSATAAEIKVLLPRAIFTVMQEVGPEFERKTGHKLNVEWGLTPAFLTRIDAGEAFDVIASQPVFIDGLIKSGKVLADTKTMLARAGTGVEVRAGAPKPDVRTVEAFKRSLLNAKSIGYLKIGGVPQLIDRLGLTDTLKAKTTIPDTDAVSEMVAKGDLEIGIVIATQILTTHGVELAGQLPEDIQIYIQFAGALSARSQAPEAGKALIRFLSSPEIAPVLKKQGMEPG